MRKIAYTRPDGGVSIVNPVRNSQGDEGLTDEQIEARAWNRLPSEAINPEWISESAIPTDRTFRNAWKHEGVSIFHDMEKCRAIHKDRLRDMRKPKLEALDIAYQRADEVGDVNEKKNIAEKKQALRDVTDDSRIKSATTPEELKTIIPEALNG